MNYHGMSFLIFCFDFASTDWDKSPFIFEGEWGYEEHLEGGYEEHLEDWAASLTGNPFIYLCGYVWIIDENARTKAYKIEYSCHKELSNRIKGTGWFHLSEDEIISVLQEISQSPPFEGIYGWLSCACPCF
jgi:hypothetical protein